MPYRIIILFSFLLSMSVFSQTKVDRTIEQLELLSNASFDNWKYSLDFSNQQEKISSLSYNDTDWKTLKLNDKIFPDSCWLRKVIELPEYIGGQFVEGSLKFLISVDDYGYLFVNGESKGHFPWSGSFILTDKAKPGDKFVLLVKAVNTGGPLRLIQAQLEFDKDLPIRKAVRNFILSLKTGQKLLSSDTYQTNSRVTVDPGTDKSQISKSEKEELNSLLNEKMELLDIEALKKGENQKFMTSLEKARNELKPIADYAKRFTLHFTANAHIDAAWLWRIKETIEVCNQTFSSVMNMFEARKDNSKINFAFAQSQAAFYEWMYDYNPELFEKIKEKVQEGNWEIVGGMWVEPDCNLPDGVSWSRQLLYGQKFFEEKLGKRATIGWNPDSFGYTWNMPQFFVNSGIDVFITQKIGWNDTSVFPHRVFWWEAKDGTRILAYFPFDYVNDVSNPFGIIDWLRQFEANTGFTDMMILFGVGNHGGGPSIEMMKRIDDLKELDIFPNIKYGTAGEYIDWLKKQNLDAVPVWKDELYLEYHRGTYTTQSNTKRNNRYGEKLLTNAEKFSSIAALYGGEYEAEMLKKAWKNVLFNQFHDILPGSSIKEVYLDSQKEYEYAFKLGRYAFEKSLGKISEKINTTGLKNGKPLVVYNSLSWERTDVVKVQLPEGKLDDYELYSSDGKLIDSQIHIINDLNRELIFIAEEVPALGYKVFGLVKKMETMDYNQTGPYTALYAMDKEPPDVINVMIENEYFKVNIDTDSGWVKSIYDKVNGKEVLSGFGNKLQLLEDRPEAWDAWNIGLTGKTFSTTFRKMEFIENGPVRTVVRLYHDYLKPGTKKAFPTEDFPNSFFIQDIILYKGVSRIEFKTNVEWFEEKTMLKVQFPVTVFDTTATYEIPYGSIERSTTLKSEYNKGKWEVAGLRWADLSSENYGVSLLNKAKYGYDIKDSNIRLSLLRSPKWPDKNADIGFHEIEYALYPHSGNEKDAETIKKGYEYNNDLIAVVTNKSEGTLPLYHSFVQLEPGNVILTSIKKEESRNNSFIYQFYETSGKNALIKLKLPGNPVRVEYSNFIEDEGEPIKLKNNNVEVKINANAVMTIKIIY